VALQETGGGSEEDMTDEEEKEPTGEKEDVSMTETVNTFATATGTETDMGAQYSKEESHPADLCEVVQVYHHGAGDGSQTYGRCGVVPGAIKRKRRVQV